MTNWISNTHPKSVCRKSQYMIDSVITVTILRSYDAAVLYLYGCNFSGS